MSGSFARSKEIILAGIDDLPRDPGLNVTHFVVQKNVFIYLWACPFYLCGCSPQR
jgi:hypothetical protein